ncbi:MAG: gliding motility protein GldL, partial [Muribaculaceae bacterium]|nr:gliding motility protein GldL [Muribaculaceae bacterium]
REEVFPVLESRNPEDRPDMNGSHGGGVIINGGGGYVDGGSFSSADTDGNVYISGGGAGGGVSAAQARSAAGLPDAVQLSEEDTNSLRESISRMAQASEQLSQMAELTTATRDYLQQLAGIADQMTQLRETTASLNEVSSVLLSSYKAITDNSDSISRSSEGYVDKMEDLNRNIGGLNTIYEIQLKSISSQLESIDRVNRGLKDIRDMYEKSAAESAHYCEETEKMARYMKQLNSVYEKMITAMTINMYNPMMGGARPADMPANPFEQSAQQDA